MSELAELFDRAMFLRDADDYDGASQLLRELVSRARPDDGRRLFAQAHVQLGAICKWQKRLEA
ncbi:MAG: hypothetical protein HOV81_08480 [Kofleriaceae bacterium]|nr:hypothetical protein [Kofleriaceae bacterium]